MNSPVLHFPQPTSKKLSPRTLRLGPYLTRWSPAMSQNAPDKFSLFVTPGKSSPNLQIDPPDSSQSGRTADRLTLDWLFDTEKDRSFSGRVLARLIQAEAHEPLVYFKDDIRQAFITVTLAARGNTMPFVVASYQMYGVHPDKLWPKMTARRNWLLGHPTFFKKLASGEPLPPSAHTRSGDDPLAPKSVPSPERKQA